ncbi:DUF3077 domain-containing protein [Pseudomonas putida]|uniref:DUF3077 domain-containing protein n=1 Tax=Pseudomonas putida TaxID=303 RepID=UPI00209C579E|nr:DUF3077 domain-containing protein [Pseudomonas putida]
MTTEDTQFTVGETTFYQGENGTHPLFRIEPGVPCRDAREQSSELMGYVRCAPLQTQSQALGDPPPTVAHPTNPHEDSRI